MESAIRAAVTRALAEIGVDGMPFTIEHPADLSHGDYATNAALMAAKHAGANPRTLAEQLVTLLAGSVEDVADISIAGPGFINFHLSRGYFTKALESALAGRERWGASDRLANDEVMIEYTSPNLFKPLHVGNLVGNIIGESLSRLFEHQGATVHRLNYPSDIGLTVAKGVWGLQKTGGNPDDIEELGRAYVLGSEAYEAGGEGKLAIDAVNRALYARSDAALNDLRDRGIATSRARLTELCRMLGTQFDTEIFESEAGPVGADIVKNHVADSVFAESDGAIVYEGGKAGLHTRVFLNSQGLPTYEAKDVGNFTLKQERYPAWTHSIVVTGGEQAEYFKVVYAAIRELYADAREKRLEHIPTGFLTLTTGKMSSRKGNVLTGESLLAELEEQAMLRAKETRADDVAALGEMIAVAALKFQILRQKVGSNIVFDKHQALSFEGDSGPYLQYTHARIVSVLEKARATGVDPSFEAAPSVPYPIERLIYRFPEVLARALDERSPHFVVIFLTELASTFNSFYAEERIADATDKHAPYKAAIADAVRQTLANGLWALGMRAPEQM